ncbi:DTW domain-containing protein YfiP [Paucibacter oligotrophus]|uniref:tRNA-uridine aminocarboxypropyltransferase n=1 Tax=Roseateles oligotrophus TaxID=1769250 RepID=A0A840L2B0_9BURK|nr:tRNA-uridine aminocarboxypropyltransferase [Roseateles oligotrophus]MBB4842604.1 DTW domain-containing protein YfiP [Roseateles oligotrophus]
MICRACELPLAACLCAWVRPVDNRVELIVLQHPQEQHQAKGTVRLLQRCLSRCRVLVGEGFDEALLAPLLGAGTALLYPMDATALAGATAGPVQRLILLDATWRKSRKMLQLNPRLQTLPRLALTELPPSGYAIRRAQRPEQRSSLEAAALALQQLEAQVLPGLDRYRPLWEAFEGFVADRQKFG